MDHFVILHLKYVKKIPMNNVRKALTKQGYWGDRMVEISLKSMVVHITANVKHLCVT